MNLLLMVLRDDLNVVLSLVIGVALVGRRIPRRSRFPLRAAVSVAGLFCWFLLIGHIRGIAAVGSLALVIGKYVICYGLAVAGTLFCYRCKPIRAVFCVTIAYCMEHISQRIVGIARVIYGTSGSEMSMALYWLLLIPVSAAVFSLTHRLMLRPIIQSGDELFSNNWRMIAMAACVVCADIVLSMYCLVESVAVSSAGLRVCSFIFSIICSFLALQLSLCQTLADQAGRETDMVKRMLHNEREQYQREKTSTDMINIKCHDLKHQVAALKGRLDEQELEELQQAVDIYDASMKTGNPALDVVLANKSLLCLDKHIAITCIAGGECLCFMREADIYSLFSNILDNAIEAVDRLEDREKRLVCLTVSTRNAFIFIHEENYYKGELTFVDGIPQTTKEDKCYHGFGSKSIRTIVEKYGGDVQISAENGIFILDVMLPVAEREEERSA